MSRDSYIFYRNYFECIEELPTKDQLAVYKAISNYALNGIEADLKGTAKIIYQMAKPNIDSNNKKYKNGCKGGRPRDEEEPRKEIEDIEFVNITESQYQRACEKFGENITNRAISILESWLGVGGKTQQNYLGRNHYGFFKKDNWVIKKAQEEVRVDGFDWSV